MAEEDERLIGDDDRNEIYNEFLENEHKEPEKEPEKAPEPEAGAVTPSAEPEKEPEKAEEPPPVREEEEKHKKLVPLDALHEERQKHKETKARIRELENQMQILLSQKKEPEPAEEEITDYDLALKTSKRKIEDLERKYSEVETLKRQLEAERQSREQIAVQTQMMNTMQELDSEGFPGFLDFEPNVANELLRLWNEDPDNQLLYPNNPDGWKKIYKERIYPKVRRIAGSVDVKDIMADKRQAKEGATLVRTTGSASKPPPKKSEADDWDYDKYLSEARGYKGA